MQRIRRSWWIVFGLVTLTWGVVEREALFAGDAVPVRALLLQYSGLLAMAWMSVAMILATRPQRFERWFGGLDKMYRLHKWVGISGFALSVAHWLIVNAPKWAGALGLASRGPRGPRVAASHPIEAWLRDYRGLAESIGGWAFAALVVLTLVSLVSRIPYRFFYATHRWMAACYLALLLHTIVLTTFAYWTSPLALVMLPLLGWGAWASVIVLRRRVGASRQVDGTIATLAYYPGVHALEVAIDIPTGWPGHAPGQFAFVTSNRSEGAHPYTMASAWQADTGRITFVVKALGDYTARLRDTLHLGQAVRVEGPYGAFTFEGSEPRQIWVGAGIGITPFIARMKFLASAAARSPRIVDLFHATAEEDEGAFARLRADAAASGIHLHLLVDHRDGLLSADRIREAVPQWRDASIWFCGPSGLGEALRADFAACGFPVNGKFHHELFAMR
jgi:predicted ferric reductase